MISSHLCKPTLTTLLFIAITFLPIYLYAQESESDHRHVPSLFDQAEPFSSEFICSDLARKLSPLPGFEKILDPFCQRVLLSELQTADRVPCQLLMMQNRDTQPMDLIATDDTRADPRASSEASISYEPNIGGSLVLQGSTNIKKYRVTLYEDSYNGSGAGELLCIEAIRNEDSGEYYFRFIKMGDPDRHVPWNNMLSSIQSGAKWRLYGDENCSDFLTNGDGDASYVGNDYNDKTSSLTLRCQDTYNTGYFYMYEDSNYGGELLPLAFWRYGTGYSEGRVIQCDNFDNHWNDRISYIKVSSEEDQTWFFYEDKDFGGTEIYVKSGEKMDLAGQYMNDEITSFKLRVQ